jgi:hypothetical protein
MRKLVTWMLDLIAHPIQSVASTIYVESVRRRSVEDMLPAIELLEQPIELIQLADGDHESIKRRTLQSNADAYLAALLASLQGQSNMFINVLITAPSSEYYAMLTTNYYQS